MKKSFPRLSARNYRLFVICAILAGLVSFGISASSHSGDDNSRRDPSAAAAKKAGPAAFINSVLNFPMPLPSLTVTVTDTIPGDGPEVGKAGVGETIRYTVKIDNAGPDAANNLILEDTIDGNTTLVPGSIVTSPLAVNDTYQSVGNMTLTTSTLGADCNANPLRSVTCNETATLRGGTLTGFGDSQANANATAAGGNVTVAGKGTMTLNADGTFVFNPVAGFEGSVDFWYTIGNTAGSDNAKITITVGGANGMVWFIDNTPPAASSNVGTQQNPFTSLASFVAINNGAGTGDTAADANNTIFVYESNTAYSGPVTLLSGQKFIGQDTTLSLATLGAPSAQPGNAYPAVNNPTADNVNIGSAAGGIMLNSNNVMSGFTMTGVAGTALQGTNFGTLSLSGVNVSSSAQALSLSNGALAAPGGGAATFGTVSSGGGTNGILLSNVTGSMTASGGTLTGTATGPTFSVVGGTVSVTYSGGITQGANNAAVSVTGGHNTGTITFQTGTISATAGTGLQFSNADGTYNFNGTTTLGGGDAGVDILTDSAGSFTFTSATSITSPSGTAFNVDGGGSTSTASVTYSGNITQASNAAMVSVTNHNTGTITFQTGTLNATNGTGLQFSNADSTSSYNFNGTTTLNGGDAGIDIITGSDGTFSFSTNTSITRAAGVAGAAFNLASSNSNVTYNGSMSLGSGTGNMIAIDNHDSGTISFLTGNLTKASSTTQGISIQNCNGGTININNPTVTITMTSANAVSLTNNSGATISFNPAGGGQGIDLTTTSGIGFNATGGGTVTVAGTSNTITSTTGIGLNVTSTEIGSAGLNFVSINTNGASSGIVLTSTGTAAGNGGLTVTGSATGSDRCGGTITNINTPGTAATVNAKVDAECTGGTIQATSAAGVILNGTKNTSLSRMRILNAGTDGISVNNINGFTLTNSQITDSSGVAQDRGIDLGDFSTGTAVNGTITITNSTLGPTPHDNFGVGIGSGTSTWSITGTLFDDSQLNSGFNFEIRNATVSSFNMSGCVLRNQFADGLQMQPSGSSTGTITTSTFQNNTFLANNLALDLNHDGTANITYRVINNTFLTSHSHAVNIFSSAVQAPTTGGTYNVRFEGNVIGNAASSGSGSAIGNGLRVNINGGTDATATILNNTIRQAPVGRGMEIISRNGTGGLDVTVAGNNVNHTNTSYCLPAESSPCAASFPLAAIFIQANCIGNCNSVRADVRGNTVPSGTASDLLTTYIQVLETAGAPVTGTPSAVVVDNAPTPSASATAELTESHTNPAHNNTGSASAESDVGLHNGSISTVAVNMLQLNDQQQYYALSDSDNSNNSLLAFVNNNKDSNSFAALMSASASGTGATVGTELGKEEAGAGLTSGSMLNSSTEVGVALGSFTPEIEKGAFALAHGGNNSPTLAGRLSRAVSAVAEAVAPSAHAAPAPMPALEVNENLGSLPAGKSVTVVFEVTVNGPHPFASYTNNATVKATGIADIQKQNVTPGDRYNNTTTLTASPTSPASQGETVTFTATVTPSEAVGTANPATGGFVQFKDNGVNMGAPVACTADGNNCKAELQTTTLPAGAHPITAEYLGGTHHEASASGTTNYTVNACTTNPVVTTIADGTSPVPPGSLREALATVCASVPNNKITFATGAGQAFDPATGPHVIQLTAALPPISKNIVIEGPGANVVEVRGSQVNLNSFRVFSVSNAATNAQISGLTISGGSDALGGGGVANAGTLTLSGCAIGTSANTNITTGSGGGIHNTGTLTIDKCTISNNVATISGGGIFNAPLATLTVRNSTISTNTSNGGNNTGGGVNNAGTATFTNVTVAANLLGGGIANANATPTSFSIGNTIAADSAGGSDDLSGIFNSVGHNLFETVGTATIGGTTTGNQTGVDPKLGALANNGGPTLTHALLFGSPAMDAGDNCVFDNTCVPALGISLTTDQRGTGFNRKVDSADSGTTQTVDIGSFEVIPTISDIPNKTDALEDTPVTGYSFNVGDAAIGIDSITASATTDPSGVIQSVTVNNATTATPDLTITPAADKSGTATITVTVNKTIGGTLLSMSDTFDVTFNSVNDAPVANNDTGYSTDEDVVGGLTVNAASGVLANDTDADSVNKTAVKVSDPSNGTVTLSTDGSFTYTPTANFNGTDSFTYKASDGTNESNVATVSITVNAVNDPIGTIAPGAVTLSEDSTNFAITGMSITDVDTVLAPNGVYQVTLTPTNGTMSVTTNPGISFDTGDGTADTTMTFHGTLASINTALATATYTPTADFSGAAQLSFQATDTFSGIVATGTGVATSDGNTINITVTGDNDTPSIGSVSGDSVTYIEEAAAVLMDNGANATVSDADSTNFDTGNLTVDITVGEAANQDVLSIVPGGTITLSGSNVLYNGTPIGTFSGGTNGNALVVTFNANSTLDRVADLIHQIAYSNTNTFDPNTAARTISFTVNDGDGGSATSAAANVTVNITSRNDAPSLLALNSDFVTFNENGSAVKLDDGANAAVSDDLPDMNGGTLTVSITSGKVAAEDQLNLNTSGNVTVAGNVVSVGGTPIGTVSGGGAGGGDLVFNFNTAQANVAHVGQLLRNIEYFNSGGDTPTGGQRGITWTLVDGDGTANPGETDTGVASSTVSVVAQGDAPTLTNNGLTVNEGATGNVIGSGALSLNDPDNPPANTLNFQVASLPASGTLKKSGTAMGVNDTFSQDDLNNNRITYDHDGSETTSDSFNFTATDGTNNIGSTAFNITVTPQNDAPSLTTNSALTVVPGTTGTIDSAKLSVTDVDNTAADLVYTVGTAPVNGDLKNNGVTLASGGTFTQDDVNNNLVTYTHNGGPVTTDSFTFTVSDGAGGSIGTTTFNININCTSNPVVTGTNDSGPGSLREAIQTACAGSNITFNLDSGTDAGYDSVTDTFTIKLTTGELLISRDMTITGPNNQRVIVSGNNTDPNPANRSRVFNIASGTVTIHNLTIANGESQFGGGIYNLGNLTLVSVTLRGNKAVTVVGAGGDGGAIDSDSGTLTIYNSTISGNTADGGGGGIHNCGDSTATLLNVTITGNRSDADDLSPGEGGGLEQVSSNSLTLSNTIVAGNLKGTGTPVAEDISVFGPGGIDLANSKNNLIGDAGTSGGITNGGANGNIVGNAGAGTIDINTVLDLTLANNGGPTPTHKLVPGSPAINKGSDALVDSIGLPTDQRLSGFNRKIGTVDIGAFEVQAGIGNSLAFNVQPSNTNAGVAITPAVTVRILDVLGNLTTSTANVTLAIGNNPSGGTLSGTTTVAAVNGTATFSDLSINNIGVGYTLAATSAGVAGATSNAFNIISASLVTGTKTASGTFSVGQAISYTITLINSSAGTQLDNAGNELTDVLPAGMTLVSASATTGTAVATLGTNTVTWNGAIPGNSSVTITINATINAGTSGQTISNQGAIAYDADGNGTNEAAGVTDDPGVAGAGNPTAFIVNAVPTITPVGVTRKAGDAGSGATIANVNDLEDAENALTVTVNNGASATVNGVTVSGLSVSAAGVVTASVEAACGATNAGFTLKVADTGGQSSTGTLNVTVNPNTAPVLSYSTQGVDVNGSLNFNPATGPSDSNAINTIAVLNAGTYTGGISVNNATGAISITNAAPAGSHTITIRATDACGLTTDAQFTLNVNKLNQTVTFNPTPPLNRMFGDADFQVNATASSGLAVTYGVTGPCTINGNTVHLTGAGDCTLTATQAGDATYNQASTQQVFTINKAFTHTVITSSVNPSAPGQNVTFTATVNANGVTPTGTLQFKVNGVNQGAPVNLDANGSASFSTSTLVIGTHTISADYSGGANFTANTGTMSVFQTVSIQSGLSISDVSVTEGNSGTVSAVFTVTLSQSSAVTVTVDYATADNTATTADSDYQSATGTLTFNAGETSKTVTVLVNGDTKNEPNETFFVNLTNAVNANIGDNQGTGTITNDDGPTVQLSNSTYTINEGANNTPQGFTSLAVDVIRTGDTSQPATVRYITSDASGGNECTQVTGQASQRCDYILVGATLRFAAGETTKTIQIPIVNDGYLEGAEFLNIELTNASGVTIGSLSSAIITIQDDAADATPTTSANNPYLSNPFFVRQNYLDLLGRDADQAGFTDWTNVLNNCGPQQGFLGAPLNCDRAHVSHGFFASPEFTRSGLLIYRLFEVGMDRLPLYREFIPDMATLSGFNLTPAQEQQNLADYLQEFTSKQEFINRFQDVSQPAQAALFIERLEQTAGVTLPATATTLPGQPTQYGRQELINLRANGTLTLGQTLKAFVEQKDIYDLYFPSGHVTMLYFAYLRRDPNLNDPGLVGWNDWVDVFTNGKPSAGIPPRDIHHLIFGFIYSEEYRKRFGQP